MGTMISLAVGRLEVDWGKNNFFSDHGSLFQSTDLKQVPSYYASEDWPDGEPIVEMDEGFGKPLGEVVDRLELLGHTMKAAEHDYLKLHQLHEMDEQPIPFEQIRSALARVDVNAVNGNYGEDYRPGQFVRKEILERLALHSERHDYHNAGLRPDHWEVDLLLENFGANNALRLLAENGNNHSLDVCWDFSPLVASGWASREEFSPGPPPENRFLIVTEGSSDAKIIQHALDLLRPHVADSFLFVDMEEGYPFTGTGNLYKFTQGLVSIGVLNNTIIVYDNDAEGVTKLQATESMTLPINLRAIKLPDLNQLSDFQTVGPNGESIANINGQAAEIECYLDLEQNGLPRPVVRWGAFNKDLGLYHGELLHKTQYMRRFLGLREANSAYDFSKLEKILDTLIAECVSVAESKLIAAMA